MAIRDRIQQAREAAGLNKSQLARHVGVTKGAVANWEAPGRAAPSTQNLAEVAKALDVSFEWLATGRGPMLRYQLSSGNDGRPMAALLPNEEELLELFRRQPAKRKEAIVALLKTF